MMIYSFLWLASHSGFPAIFRNAVGHEMQLGAGTQAELFRPVEFGCLAGNLGMWSGVRWRKNLRLFLDGLLDFVETQFNIDTCWFPHAGATRGHAHRLLREQLDEASLSWYIQRIFRFDPIPTTFMIFCFTSERVNLVCVCVCICGSCYD